MKNRLSECHFHKLLGSSNCAYQRSPTGCEDDYWPKETRAIDILRAIVIFLQ